MWFQIAEAAPSLAKEHLPAGCECRKVLKHLKLLYVFLLSGCYGDYYMSLSTPWP